MKRGGVLLTLWVVVAFTAIGVGTWALSLVGGRINDRSVQPLSQSDIQNQLADERSAGTTPAPSDPGSGTTSDPTSGSAPNPRPTVPTGGERGLRTDGGSIVASCSNGKVKFLSWSPAPGYWYDDSMRNGPADVLKVEFKSDVAEKVEGYVSCVNGTPTLSLDDSSHGGSSGGSGGSGSGGTPSSGTSGSSGGAATPSRTSGGGHGSDDPSGDDHGGR